MNKKALVAHIGALEEALTQKGVTFVKADTSGTNAELEKEIERLELLIDDGDACGEGQKDPNLDSSGLIDTEVKIDEVKRVKIAKGVNVEMTDNNVKHILRSGLTYAVPADRAKSLVAEKLGEFVDD